MPVQKETKPIQEGVEIDGIPGKERLKVRGCVGFCGYYVQPTDTYCLNCGLIEPYRERPQALSIENASSSFVMLFAVFPLLSLLAGSILFIIGRIFVGLGNLTPFFRSSCLIYITLVLYHIWLQLKSVRISRILKHLKRKYADCLLNKESEYMRWLEANNGEMRRLGKMLQDNMSLENTARNALALATIKEVLKVRSCRSLQCEVILWEIGKARLANKGLVVLFDQSSSSVTRRENYVQLLKEHMEKGYALVRQWQHDEDRRIQDVLTRLQESLTGCEDVRGALLAQQAKILATGVTNFENCSLHLAQTSTEETEMFHTLGAATDTLFAGFGELEREYYRLLGEKEVIQELGTVH